ncbi:MAG: tripartite tricarboxylate transporter substrate binding protein, partial [Roseococcus sp.]
MSLARRALLASPILAAPALAQSGPTAVLVPYAPGGASDVVGRILIEGLAQRLGGTFVMDHRPGASTTIAARQVARA